VVPSRKLLGSGEQGEVCQTAENPINTLFPGASRYGNLSSKRRKSYSDKVGMFINRTQINMSLLFYYYGSSCFILSNSQFRFITYVNAVIQF